MTNLHRLPEPVPEGWEPTRPGATVMWRRVNGKVTRPRLMVGPDEGWWFNGDGIRYNTLPEACAAAERAFCGCYVGAVLPRKG